MKLIITFLPPQVSTWWMLFLEHFLLNFVSSTVTTILVLFFLSQFLHVILLIVTQTIIIQNNKKKLSLILHSMGLSWKSFIFSYVSKFWSLFHNNPPYSNSSPISSVSFSKILLTSFKLGLKESPRFSLVHFANNSLYNVYFKGESRLGRVFLPSLFSKITSKFSPFLFQFHSICFSFSSSLHFFSHFFFKFFLSILHLT